MTNDLEAARAALLAKQRKELERMEAEHAVAVLAPIAPKRAMLVSTGEKAWLTYEAPSLWAALDIMAKFQPLALGKFKGTYTRVEPAEVNAARKERDRGEEVDGPYLCEIETNGGTFGHTATLQFYARLGGDVVKVKCDLGQANRSYHMGQYAPQFQQDSRGQAIREGENGRHIHGHWMANSRLSGMAETYIRWGTGDAKGSRFTYQISADYMDDDSGVAGWDIDAVHRLNNIAEQMHGSRTSCIHRETHRESSAGNGKVLEMADGSIWFHPFSGAAPTCEKEPEVSSC